MASNLRRMLWQPLMQGNEGGQSTGKAKPAGAAIAMRLWATVLFLSECSLAGATYSTDATFAELSRCCERHQSPSLAATAGVVFFSKCIRFVLDPVYSSAAPRSPLRSLFSMPRPCRMASMRLSGEYFQRPLPQTATHQSYQLGCVGPK